MPRFGSALPNLWWVLLQPFPAFLRESVEPLATRENHGVLFHNFMYCTRYESAYV